MQIALLVTCLGDVLRPGAGRAVVRILRRLGHEVVFPAAQTCCGQPLFNSGYAEHARAQARHTIEVFEPYTCVVTPSGSCAAMIQAEYAHLFHDDPAWQARSAALAAKTFEFSEFLVERLHTLDVGARFHGTVAYHFACHLRMLKHAASAEKLIQHVSGATLVPLPRQEQCCGFGGSFAVRYPQISGALVHDKARCVVETGASALVSTDTGCLMNIGGRLHRQGHELEVLHIAELLERR